MAQVSHILYVYMQLRICLTRSKAIINEVNLNASHLHLNVPSPELRRLHADLFWCYKVAFGLAKVQSGMFFIMNPCTRAATNACLREVVRRFRRRRCTDVVVVRS